MLIRELATTIYKEESPRMTSLKFLLLAALLLSMALAHDTQDPNTVVPEVLVESFAENDSLPTEVAADSNTGVQGTHAFNPTYKTVGKTPHVAGSQQEFDKRMTQAEQDQSAANNESQTAQDQAAALDIAKRVSAEHQQEELKHAMELKVTKLMNKAAGDAKKFESATRAHDDAVTSLSHYEKLDKQQAKNVEDVEKMLEKEKKARQGTRAAVKKAQGHEQSLRYKAQYSGHAYTESKDAAIAADEEFHRKKKQEQEKEYFAKVAEQAVAKAAAEKLSADDQIKKTAENDAIEANAVDANLQAVDKPDCKELPDEYKHEGGSCDDCPDWAKQGRCTDDRYQVFMKKFCPASCRKQSKASVVAVAKAATETAVKAAAAAAEDQPDEAAKAKSE